MEEQSKWQNDKHEGGGAQPSAKQLQWRDCRLFYENIPVITVCWTRGYCESACQQPLLDCVLQFSLLSGPLPTFSSPSLLQLRHVEETQCAPRAAYGWPSLCRRLSPDQIACLCGVDVPQCLPPKRFSDSAPCRPFAKMPTQIILLWRLRSSTTSVSSVQQKLPLNHV